MPNEINVSVVPQEYISNGFDNVVTNVQIQGYNEFDPFSGVTVQVVLFNASNQIVKVAQVRITGNDWQNWPATENPEEDTNYVINVVMNALGFTKS